MACFTWSLSVTHFQNRHNWGYHSNKLMLLLLAFNQYKLRAFWLLISTCYSLVVINDTIQHLQIQYVTCNTNTQCSVRISFLTKSYTIHLLKGCQFSLSFTVFCFFFVHSIGIAISINNCYFRQKAERAETKQVTQIIQKL